MMKYKGYTGVLEIDEESGILYGDVVGLRDVITFQGETVPEARQAFQDSVDCFLELCASRNEPPEKPFSGRFLVRISSPLHRRLVEEAQARRLSLNALVERTLAEAFPTAPGATEVEPEAVRTKGTKPKVRKPKGAVAGAVAGGKTKVRGAARASRRAAG